MTASDLWRTKGARIVLVVLLQSLALGAIIADHALTLAAGREVVLKTVPVDPRDLFRGDYVSLSYAISRLELGRLDGSDDFSPGEPAYVTLARKGDDWAPVAVAHKLPPGSRDDADRLTLRATTTYVYEAPARPTTVTPETPGAEPEPPCPEPCKTLLLSYGIESYFVPEGTGRALEQEQTAKRLSVVVAVRANGCAAIKALKLDDKVLAREGLL